MRVPYLLALLLAVASGSARELVDDAGLTSHRRLATLATCDAYSALPMFTDGTCSCRPSNATASILVECFVGWPLELPGGVGIQLGIIPCGSDPHIELSVYDPVTRRWHDQGRAAWDQSLGFRAPFLDVTIPAGGALGGVVAHPHVLIQLAGSLTNATLKVGFDLCGQAYIGVCPLCALGGPVLCADNIPYITEEFPMYPLLLPPVNLEEDCWALDQMMPAAAEPSLPVTAQVTVQSGGNILISSSGSLVVGASEEKDARIAELEAEVARLTSELASCGA
jgi:uncharacterized small protein (DUF1192 family)